MIISQLQVSSSHLDHDVFAASSFGAFRIMITNLESTSLVARLSFVISMRDIEVDATGYLKKQGRVWPMYGKDIHLKWTRRPGGLYSATCQRRLPAKATTEFGFGFDDYLVPETVADVNPNLRPLFFHTTFTGHWELTLPIVKRDGRRVPQMNRPVRLLISMYEYWSDFMISAYSDVYKLPFSSMHGGCDHRIRPDGLTSNQQIQVGNVDNGDEGNTHETGDA
jgi:hypothetical protein